MPSLSIQLFLGILKHETTIGDRKWLLDNLSPTYMNLIVSMFAYPLNTLTRAVCGCLDPTEWPGKGREIFGSNRGKQYRNEKLIDLAKRFSLSSSPELSDHTLQGRKCG